jgi:hypothetical protein
MRINAKNEPLFDLGDVVASAGAHATMERMAAAQKTTTDALIGSLIRRHHFGDWGQTSAESAAQNESAIANGDDRIFSVYELGGTTFWVITEHDRSVTTILLPEDY